MNGSSASGPGSTRVSTGTIEINRRPEGGRITLVLLNTGDRPIQLGSHLHLPDANSALDFDRAASHGFRLDIPSGTSIRLEPGVSRQVDAVRILGNRVVPGIQRDKAAGGALDG